MKNVLLCGLMGFYPNIMSRIKEQNPNVLITPNFEEVFAMVKSGEDFRLCIIIGGYNYSKSSVNGIDGYTAVEEIHAVNPNIPILVINGGKMDISEKTGLLERISSNTENVTYIDMQDQLKAPDDFINPFFQASANIQD